MKLRICLLAFFACSASALAQQSYVKTVAAGFVPWGQNPVALQQFLNPAAVTYDPQGNLYYADLDKIWRLNADGSDTLMWQIPGPGAYITAIAVDGDRNIYIADWGNLQVWKITAAGVATALAQPQGPFVVPVLLPAGLALGADGTLYLSDSINAQIFAYPPGGGAPKAIYAGEQKLRPQQYQLVSPTGLAISADRLFIADPAGSQILEDDLTTGLFTFITGDGSFPIHGPIAVNPAGTLFFGTGNQIYEINPGGGAPQVYAGSLSGALLPEADGPALAVTTWPAAIAVNPTNGDLAIGDSDSDRIRIVRAATQNVEAVAGEAQFSGDGIPAVLASIPRAGDVKNDAAGNVYYIDSGVRIRKIDGNGTVETIAGNGLAIIAGDGMPALQVSLGSAEAMAVDPAGNNIFVQVGPTSAIRKIDKSGMISTIAGAGTAAPADGMPAIQASMPPLAYLAADSSGNLYISTGAYVWRMDSSGILHRFAGGGSAFVENAVATQVNISSSAIAVDSGGNVYFGNGASVVKVDPSGRIYTVPGSTSQTYPGPVLALAVDAQDNLYFSYNSRYPAPPAIQKLTAAGVLSTVAQAEVHGLAVDSVGNIYYPSDDPYIYRLSPASSTPAPVINPAGVVGAGGSVPAVPAVSPNALASIYGSNFIAAGTHRDVLSSDLVNGKLPSSLAGVCVHFGNQPAAILAVYPGQINVEVPALPAGSVTVQVTVNCGTPQAISSNLGAVTAAPASPEFFSFAPNGTTGQNPIAALNATTGAPIDASNPAKPGDLIEAYGTGWGITNPMLGSGVIPGTAVPLATTPVLIFGGAALPAGDILYAGAAPCCAGLFQVDFRVPDGTAAGNQVLLINTSGYTSSFGAYIPVQ